MNATKLAEREFILECIEVYKSLPALWNVHSKAYTDRQRKSDAYNVLVAKYNEMYPEATREDVKKKFNSLRTNFRKELHRMNSLREGGLTSDDNIEPTSWYFDKLRFLEDHGVMKITPPSYNCRNTNDQEVKTRAIKCIKEETANLNGSVSRDNIDWSEDDDGVMEIARPTSSYRNTNEQETQKRIIWRRKDPIPKENGSASRAEHAWSEEDEHYDDELQSRLSLPAQVTPKRISRGRPSYREECSGNAFKRKKVIAEEYEITGRAWALELQKMESTQQMHAKKAINDILYEGQLGNLTRNCVKIVIIRSS